MKTQLHQTLLRVIIPVFYGIIAMYSLESRGQNAPITTLGTVGNALPGQVYVPITVTNFTNIGAVSLCFDYQFAGLHFIQGTPNPGLSGFAIGDQDLGNGMHRVTMGWFGNGTTLPDGTSIMTVSFTYVNGITALEFYDNGPSCEYADGGYNVLNDVPQSTYYIDGTVCGNIGNPGQITGNASVCQGQAGVGYSIPPLPNVTSYIWLIPPGATIISGINTNAISVNYSMAAISGTIAVHGVNVCGNGPSSLLAITVNQLPVANAGPDVTIPYGTSTTLNAASGGTGSFSYHWSPETLLVNPDLQNPQTVNLTATTVFTLLVTNQASLCQNSDEVIVNITGGPLNTHPVSIPDAICHGSPAQLFSNAGGGSGTYDYTWSCTPPGSPPWSSNQSDPVVSPDSTTVYHLTLTDGFTTVQGSTTLTVHQLPTATISGGDTLCGAGNSTVLTVNLTGIPPWSFYYSNGINTWLITGQNTSPYLIVATDPGIYTILAMSDAECTGITAGMAVVGVFPVPPTPVISINGTSLSSTGCCGNQWYLEGVPVAGATSQNFEPVQTGHYFDIVTVDGCSSDTSNVIYFLMANAAKHNMGSFSLEPNPAKNFITIKLKSGALPVEEVKIYSITGKPEAAYSFKPMNAEKSLVIDIQYLLPGLYFMSVGTKSDKTVMKLIVQ